MNDGIRLFFKGAKVINRHKSAYLLQNWCTIWCTGVKEIGNTPICVAVGFIDLYAENMAKNVTIASQDFLALSLDEC